MAYVKPGWGSLSPHCCCLHRFSMGKADMVLVGAEGVVENGGVINKVGLVLPGCVAPSFPSRPVAVTLQIGTYQIAIVAQAYNTPVYVAAESYKFTRLFPLNQRDFDSSVNASLEPVKSSVEDHDYSKYMVPHLCWFAVPVHGLTGCGCGVVLCRARTRRVTTHRRSTSRCCSQTSVC